MNTCRRPVTKESTDAADFATIDEPAWVHEGDRRGDGGRAAALVRIADRGDGASFDPDRGHRRHEPQDPAVEPLRPGYDTWFDEFAQAWGEANEVNITVDHINTADVPATIAAEISAGEGHDLVEHIASLAQYEKIVLDMTDLSPRRNNRHGEQLAMAKRNSYNPTTNVYYGFCMATRPTPATIASSLWETVELPDGPTTWDELLAGGTQIKQDQGVQMGIGMSNEHDSRMAAQTIIWAYGGSDPGRERERRRSTRRRRSPPSSTWPSSSRPR